MFRDCRRRHLLHVTEDNLAIRQLWLLEATLYACPVNLHPDKVGSRVEYFLVTEADRRISTVEVLQHFFGRRYKNDFHTLVVVEFNATIPDDDLVGPSLPPLCSTDWFGTFLQARLHRQLFNGEFGICRERKCCGEQCN